jgi:hypothetical protein
VIEEWLHEAVLNSPASDELRGWAIGRGLSNHLFSDIQVCCWNPPESPCPDPEFERKNGPSGKWRKDWMVIPYWTPRGNLAGAEFRTWGYREKKVRDYRTQNSKFSPVFLGLTNRVLHKIWVGGDVWLVEGIFDFALAHVVPPEDVILGCGTARLTNKQLDFLDRFLSPEAGVHVVYDEDETGVSVLGISGTGVEKTPERFGRRGVTVLCFSLSPISNGNT